LMDIFKLPILDVRILGAIAVTLVTVSHLGKPAATAKATRPRLARGDHGVETLAFAASPKGSWIATTNSAGRVVLRASESGGQPTRYLDFPGFATAVAFSPDGHSLAAVGLAPVIKVWNVTSAKIEPVTVETAPIRRARLVMFSPDGQLLAIATDLDGRILLWDLATRRERWVLQNTSAVTRMVFSPDGRLLATAGTKNDWSIHLWDLHTGSHRELLANGRGPTAAIAFSPDGTLLASSSFGERRVRVWDTRTRQMRGVVVEHARSVNSLAFSPDGTLLATAANDGMIVLWDVDTGRRLANLDTQATCLRTVAFSPDGRSIVLATEDDDDVRLWDVAELL
jgi:WD40 repeat protein